MQNKNTNCNGNGKGRLLTRINRISAWVLFGLMLVYFITGYGMTKGIIDTVTAARIHNSALPLVILAAFIIHSFLSIRLAFIRWKIWNKFSLSAVTAVFAAIALFFASIELSGSVSNTLPVAQASVSGQLTESASQTQVTDSSQKIFTAEELSKYDGQDGMPAYVAVDGLVYDMSRVFRSGTHFEHIAGQELTEEFYSFHVKSEITKYPVVGIYE